MDAIREGAPAAFVLERSDDNGTIEVSLRVTSSGEYLSGTTSFGATIENTPGVVTASFPGGSTETRIRFDTDDDEDVEDDASITVQIEADDGGTYVLGTPTSATVAVTSNDVVPDVNISAYPAEIGEGESAVFRLTRLLGAFRLREEMRVKIRVEDAGNDLDASRALGAAEFDADRQPDLQQEIHLALWRSFAGYESRCSLRTWVYRVAHNARVMRARRTEVMAAALIDRLLHHCRIVNIRGNSYPMREHQNLPRSASENPAERVAG